MNRPGRPCAGVRRRCARFVSGRDPAALYRTSRWVLLHVSTRRPTWSTSVGPSVRAQPLSRVIEGVAGWSEGVLHGHHELPMAYPGGVDGCTTRSLARTPLEVACRVLKARGTIVEPECTARRVGVDSALLQEDRVGRVEPFGVETIDGVRRHGIAHYLDFVEQGRIDLTPMLMHQFASTNGGRVRRARRSGIVRRDQSRTATLTRLE